MNRIAESNKTNQYIKWRIGEDCPKCVKRGFNFPLDYCDNRIGYYDSPKNKHFFCSMCGYEAVEKLI